MAGYQKTIAYLDYLENGMKISNAGFARIEGNNGQMRLEMKVKNIPENFSGQYELKTDTGGIIGQINLKQGGGSCCIVWKTGAAIPEGKRAVQANGIYIRLPGRHLIQAVWPSEMEFLAEEEEAVLPAVQETLHDEIIQENEPDPPAEQDLQTENMDVESVHNDREEKEEPKTETAEEPVCYGDKWEQLSHMYAQIHPFGDEREYLSIAPKDFVVLRQEYQKMVHNSFLLHGYYNYRHLILGKVKEKDEWRYYLGVPGNFYNREKMVAEMFGFEAFEGERNPAKAGDFGYYMKRVEI